MALTEKGKLALSSIKDYFPQKPFTARELSDASGESFVAATLNSVANKGFLIKLGGSPVHYQAIKDLDIDQVLQDEEKKSTSNNDNLHSALKAKNDEFYTYYKDIEEECKNYIDFFKNKIIYLNCDDEDSNFWKYFLNNFNTFQLKKLIATHLEEPMSYSLITTDGYNVIKTDLKGSGSYDSSECIELLDQSDIIVTNPPFSKSKEFISLICNHGKHFLVIGNENAFSSTLIFPLLKDNKVWTGFNKVSTFYTPDGTIKDFGNICWFTNLPIKKDIPFIECTKKFNKDYYLQYNNFDAINVDRVDEIPMDYDGIMGVPISFINKWNKDQFELLGLAAGNTKTNKLNFTVPYTPHPLDRGGCGIVQDTIRKYTRVFIRRK